MRRVLVPHGLRPPAPAAGRIVHALQGTTMGTTWSAKLAGAPDLALAPLRAALEARLDEVIAQMSTWEPDSDLSRFNRAAAGEWLHLPRDCFEVLGFALRVAEESGGAYDPTAGALVNLWGFGPTRDHRAPGFAAPTAADIDEVMQATGWRRIGIDEGGRRAMQPGGAYVDLSAVAKGFAVDALSRELLRQGFADHLVEIGGELRGSGAKPDGQPWWVALEAPRGDDGRALSSIETVVALHGLAVATSGDYRRAFTDDGVRRSHTIDPRSGQPITHGLASVTVLHAECMVADAQSTALTVLGLEQGLAHANRHGLAAHFVQRNARGTEERMSDALAAML